MRQPSLSFFANRTGGALVVRPGVFCGSAEGLLLSGRGADSGIYPLVMGHRRRYIQGGQCSHEESMKLIIAIIQPHRLEQVKQALAEVEVFRLTVMDVQGFGRERVQSETYRAQEFTINLARKVQIMIGVNDAFVERTVQAIIRGARSGPEGQIGDGKIFILPLEDCVRIRTGERGGEAI